MDSINNLIYNLDGIAGSRKATHSIILKTIYIYSIIFYLLNLFYSQQIDLNKLFIIILNF
jgi:hypothetical protein